MGEEPRSEPRAAVSAKLISIAALANGVGVAPYLLFVDLLRYLPLVVLGSAVLAIFALRGRRIAAGLRPSISEWLLGSWSLVALPSVGSLMGLGFYGLGYGGVKLVVAVASYFGLAIGGDPRAWGFWISIVWAGLVAVQGPTIRLSELARRLYPRESWARSEFFPLLARWRLLTTVAVGGAAALAVAFWFLDPRGVALPVVSSLVLVYTSIPLHSLGAAVATRAEGETIDRVEALLRRATYHVVRAPRTGKPEIDPLLQSVDLLAEGHGRAYAFELKTAQPKLPVEWKAATAIRTAALVLSDEIVGRGGAPVLVEPVLLLVGGSISQSLGAFSEREGVPIVHFANAGDATTDDHELANRLKAAGIVLLATSSAPSASA